MTGVFYPSSWKFIGLGLSEIWQELEDEIKDSQTKQLLHNINGSVEAWRTYQLAQLNALQDRMWRKIQPLLDKARKRAEGTFADAASIAVDSTEEALKTPPGKDEVENRPPEKDDLLKTADRVLNGDHPSTAAIASSKFVDDAEKTVKAALVAVIRRQAQNVNRIADQAQQEIVVRNEPRTRTLFTVISNVTRTERALEIPVTYSNGRQVSLRSYLDMRVREQVQTMSLDLLTQGSQRLGIRLFLVSEHADCADDHRDIQGKVCTDDPQLQAEKGYLDLDTVKWMLKRPNCRHFLIPVTREQAEHPQRTLHDLKMTRGAGDNEDNYRALQSQRALERGVRSWKTKARNDEVLLEAPAIKGTPEESQMRLQLAKDQYAAALYQKKIRELLASNKNLVRAANREQIKNVTADLGVTLSRKRIATAEKAIADE